MADVLSTHSHLGIDMTRENGPQAPLPNPPFVFPVQPKDTHSTDEHADLPPNTSTRSSPRSIPRLRPQRISLNTLPAFEFGAPSSSPTKSSSSPPRSPSRRTPPALPPSVAGHRRNGSEYIGGDITQGGPVLVSNSPTKSEHSPGHRRDGSELVGGAAPGLGPLFAGTNSSETSERSSNPQSNARLGPPMVKRGHAHRRSGAISSHDLSAVLKPPAETKAGSAPTTPSESIFPSVLPPELDRSTSQPVLSTNEPGSSPSVTPPAGPDTDIQSRPRARFSEKIDYYSPRPLSTISSETSSSMSTVRANHSVSDSFSSAVSVNTSSSPPNIYQTLRRGQGLQSAPRDQAKSRPKTAEAGSRPSSGDWSWDFTDPETPAKRPLSAPSSAVASTEDISAARDLTQDASQSSKPTHGDSISTPLKNSPSFRYSNSQLQKRRPISPTVRPRTSPEPKVTKRQRKGKSWGSFLSRKGKHNDLKEEMSIRRSPTPPLRRPSSEMDLSFDDINFEDDTTYIIEAEMPYTSKNPGTQSNHTPWKPRESSPLAENDTSAAVFDIDAALGSLDIKGSGPSFEDVVGAGGSSVPKRPMHSSGATGVFAGPGMHYHRRTESAPEMDADRPRFGFPRLGSNPAMAIEEEEEEEDEEDAKEGPMHENNQSFRVGESGEKEEQTLGLGVNIVEAETLEAQPMQRARRQSTKDTTPVRDNHDFLNPIDIVGADEGPRFSVITKSSDESTITPTISPDRVDTLPFPAATDLSMPTPALTFGTSDTTSAISSPDFTRTSFDTPRIHTATSSITDRTTLSSSRAGEHILGPHASIDDVPSLTSSASTMSAHPTRFSISANSGADRSSSLSAAVPARTRPASAHKRLSLASLSRLTGSSYNKSKLNIAETPPSETVERTEKKKGNRISRMMKFWKSKEKLSAS
ncbi:hypothetical protein ACLMJK_006613 [Lecanora helva]